MKNRFDIFYKLGRGGRGEGGGGDECERMTNLQVIRKTYCRVLDQFNKKPWRKA